MKKESALAAYNKKYKEFQKKLRKFEMCLKIEAKEHVQDPDNWGYLGVLNYYSEQLDTMLDVIQ